MRIMYKARISNNRVRYMSTTLYQTEQDALSLVECYNLNADPTGYKAKYEGPVCVDENLKEIKK